MPKPSSAILAVVLSLLTVLASTSSPRSAPAPAPASRPAAGGSPAGRPARSLLLNADFERSLSGHPWMPASWDTSTAGLPTVFFGRDSFLVHTGHWAINVANMSAAIPMGHNWSQTMLVGPEVWSKAATFKVWTRSNGLDGRAYIMIQAYNDTASKMGRIWGVDHDEALRRLQINKVDDPLLDLAWKRTSFDDAMTDWVQREARIVVPPGTNVMFVRCGLVGTGQMLFDDASLTLQAAPPPTRYARGENLFAEPGFEAHANAWDLAIPPFEDVKVEVDSTVAHSGRYSLRLSNFQNGIVDTRIGAGQPFVGRALRGQHVRLSAWLKGDSLRGIVYMKVYAHGLKSRLAQSSAGEMLSDTWDWRQVSIEYDVPDDAEEVWANIQARAPAVGRVWIDDARFEVLGPAATAAAATKKPPRAPAKR